MKTDRVANLLIASILLTIISGGIKYYNVTEKARTTALVTQAYEIVQESSQLLTLLLDIETGQRGYIISQDSSYLQPYLTSLPLIDTKINALLELTADNPHQTTILNQQVKPLVMAKVNELRKVLELYQVKNQAGAIASIKSDSGKVTMDKLRLSIADLTQHEEDLIVKRTSRLKKIYAVNDTIHYASFVMICFISGMALKALLDKEKRNKELLAALKEANTNLEIKVHERTMETEKKSLLAEKLNRDLQENFEELQSFYEALHLSNTKSEDTLREIRDLYDNAPCGYHSVNWEGLIVRMNQTELNWLGYTRDEVIGKMNIAQLFRPEDKAAYLEKFAFFLKQGYARNLEFTFVRKNGSTFQIILNATAIYDNDGNYVMSRAVVTDITERKKMEQKLLETNRNLVSLNEEKNHFLGVTIHDLKSPLDRVIGLIKLVNQQGIDRLNDSQRDFLRLIQDSCINMQTLVIDLLDINKLEQGLSAVNPEEVNLASVVERQLQIFKEQASRKNIQIQFDNNDPEKIIKTDPAILQRILENLISNAIKYSPYNKEVLVKVVHNETHYRIEIHDQGSGILPGEIPMLFKKFQRLSTQPTGGENSTGLGLSITKDLVKALNGLISVDSEVNKGSIFIVELPANM